MDTRRRTGWIRAAILLAVVPVTGVALGHQLLGGSPSTAAAPLTVSPAGSPVSVSSPRITQQLDRPAGAGATGEVSDGVTVFDDRVPAVANLDPELLAALRRAANDAGARGHELVVNSGWRSPEYQQQLLQDAISQYGSKKQAARWVATPRTSAHVAGDAVDLGPVASAAWLSRNGARYGLCQIYRNEPWHFELRPDAVKDDCPRMYADPTEDPRMQE